MRLLLIRHGESSANAEGRLQGHLDFSLSERGRAQSEALAGRLAGLEVAAIYTSPLLRARETAALIAERSALPLEERAALVERNVGELAGLTRAEIVARFPEYVRARADVRPVAVPGFEPDGALAERVIAALESIVVAHAGETAAVVTHGGVIGAFLRYALDLPVVRPGPFAIDNASLSTFGVPDGGGDGVRPRIQVRGLNDTCHPDGLET